MKKIAFEVSDNIAIYAHMLPLLKAFLESDNVSVSLFSVNFDNFSKLQAEYEFYYGEALPSCEQIVLLDGSLSKIKKNVVVYAKKYNLTILLPLIRTIFTRFRKNKKLDDFSTFYAKNLNYFLKQNVIFTNELKGGRVVAGFPKLVWLLHGIISNDNPFYKNWTCDLVISPQIGLIDKLKERTNFPSESKIYNKAYLKYDLIKLQHSTLKKEIFQNKKYTVVYNPHWDNGSGQSSWFNFGLEILEYFYKQHDVNLIFAPHISLSSYYDIQLPDKFINCDNIHVDLNSENLVRGTYICYADCYLGDVSSQYFEFVLCKPNIDAVFFNTTNLDWKNSAIYSYWDDGVVIHDVESLGVALESARKNIKDRQKRFHEIPDDQVEQLMAYIKLNFLE
ncbi:TPA: hypothetical protein R8G79_001422 [Citrobacter amalonaticus]|nr:hypothetical protein [Citrobacter amalonaticus]